MDISLEDVFKIIVTNNEKYGGNSVPDETYHVENFVFGDLDTWYVYTSKRATKILNKYHQMKRRLSEETGSINYKYFSIKDNIIESLNMTTWGKKAEKYTDNERILWNYLSKYVEADTYLIGSYSMLCCDILSHPIECDVN